MSRHRPSTPQPPEAFASRSDAEYRAALYGDDHALTYDFITCDHTAACCTLHRTHVSPHLGCVLR